MSQQDMPPGVLQFIAELREFARPTPWRTFMGACRRIWRAVCRLENLFQMRRQQFVPAFSRGAVLRLGNGEEVQIARVDGNIITLANGSTITH